MWSKGLKWLLDHFYFLFSEFAVEGTSVEEPEGQLVNVPIQVIRKGGQEGIVTLTWVARLDGKCIEPKGQLVNVPIQVVRRGGQEGIVTLTWVARLDGNNYNLQTTEYHSSFSIILDIWASSRQNLSLESLTRSYSNQQLLSYRD